MTEDETDALLIEWFTHDYSLNGKPRWYALRTVLGGALPARREALTAALERLVAKGKLEKQDDHDPYTDEEVSFMYRLASVLDQLSEI